MVELAFIGSNSTACELPAAVIGVWIHLHLTLDPYSRKVVG